MSKLSLEYGFFAFMPTCSQMRGKNGDATASTSKQLTTEETTETRMTTKVYIEQILIGFFNILMKNILIKNRWVIEAMNGALKNHYALDNINNNELGHLMIDYRNCAAMLNFNLKPRIADGQKARLIARRMRRSIKGENSLKFMISRRLDTKLVIAIPINEIIDFPKLKKKTMEQKIFFGSYQFYSSKSYMRDLLETKTVYIINEEFVKKIPDKEFRAKLTNIITLNQKIVAAEIVSRHHRSEKNNNTSEPEEEEETGRKKQGDRFKNVYRVFVQYIPNQNDTNAITGSYLINKIFI